MTGPEPNSPGACGALAGALTVSAVCWVAAFRSIRWLIRRSP